MYVIVVDFRLRPGARDEFLPLILENARRSLADEPGCRQFDVCEDPDDPGAIFLYETYDDEAAFEAHRTSPHYQAFNEASPPLVAEKRVRRLRTLEK